MAAVRDRQGRPVGVVQGVFRAGDLVQKSVAILEPRGVDLRLLDASAPEAEELLHREPSPLPPSGKGGPSKLRHALAFDLAGRRWEVVVTPARGYYTLGAGWRAWSVLAGGLAFSLVLAGYVRGLLAGQAQIRTQVEARTRELAQETESHRRDAEALRASEARFRHLVEVMGEGMWVVDPEGMTTFVNRRMAQMLGYVPEEMVGHPLSGFMFEEDRAASERSLAQRREGLSGAVRRQVPEEGWLGGLDHRDRQPGAGRRTARGERAGDHHGHHGAAPGRAGAAPEPEAGEPRGAGGRHRPRLQQPAHRHPGKHQPGPDVHPAPVSCPALPRKPGEVRASRHGPDTADAGVFRQGPFPGGAPGSEPGRGGDVPPAGSLHLQESDVAIPASAGTARPHGGGLPDPAGGHEPRHQRLRSHRRPGGHRLHPHGDPGLFSRRP